MNNPRWDPLRTDRWKCVQTNKLRSSKLRIRATTGEKLENEKKKYTYVYQ